VNKQEFRDLLPEVLYESIKLKSCGFFIGAGISSKEPTNLPGWSQLLSTFIDYSNKNHKLDQGIIKELTDSLTKGKLLEVAEFLQGNLKQDYTRFLREKFDNSNLVANDNHQLLAKLDSPLFITTNYDKLIENTIISNGNNPIVSTSFSNDLLEQIHKLTPRKKILKIHGDINDSTSLVLSETDYIKILENSMLNVILRSFFHRISFVFIGCSMTDPDVLIFLKQIKHIFNGFSPTHYALVKKDKINEIDKYIYKNIYNIEFLLIENHENVTHFLKHSVELQEESKNSNKLEDAINLHTQLNILEFFLDDLEYYIEVEIENYYFDPESNYKKIGIDKTIKMYNHINEIFEDYNSMELSKLTLFPYNDFVQVFNEIKSIIDLIKQLPQAGKKQKIVLCNSINDTNELLEEFVKSLRGYIRIKRVSISNDILNSDFNKTMLETYEENYSK
jgi:hypothetical protein